MKYFAIVLLFGLLSSAMSNPFWGWNNGNGHGNIGGGGRDPGAPPVGNVGEYVGPGQLGGSGGGWSGNNGGKDPGTAPTGNVGEYVGPGQLGGSGWSGNNGGKDPGTAPVGNVGGNVGRPPVGNVGGNFQDTGRPPVGNVGGSVGGNFSGRRSVPDNSGNPQRRPITGIGRPA